MMGSGKSTIGRALAERPRLAAARQRRARDRDDRPDRAGPLRGRRRARAASRRAGSLRRGAGPPHAGGDHRGGVRRRRSVAPVGPPGCRLGRLARRSARDPRRADPRGRRAAIRRTGRGLADHPAAVASATLDGRRGPGGRGRRRDRRPGSRRRSGPRAEPSRRPDRQTADAPARRSPAARAPRAAPASGPAASGARSGGPARRDATTAQNRGPWPKTRRWASSWITTVSSASGGARISRQLNISRPCREALPQRLRGSRRLIATGRTPRARRVIGRPWRRSRTGPARGASASRTRATRS